MKNYGVLKGTAVAYKRDNEQRLWSEPGLYQKAGIP